MTASSYPPQSPLKVGLTACCPRCGKGPLFKGFLALSPACSVCGLDYGFADSGDGPAVFIMMIAGFIVVAAALVVEVKYQPSYWVHTALFLPLALLLTIGMLRPLKAWLIAQQYKHKAEEGRLED